MFLVEEHKDNLLLRDTRGELIFNIRRGQIGIMVNDVNVMTFFGGSNPPLSTNRKKKYLG